MPLVTLIGYRGTGKSTVAELLARRLAVPWIDSDQVLETRIGRTIADLVRDEGEPVFRDVEAEVLSEILTAFSGVLATGGGVVLREANRRLIRARARPVVWLSAPSDTIRKRLASDPATPDRRPALHGIDPLAEVEAALRERAAFYSECADREIDTSSLSPETVAIRIADWLTRGELPGGREEAPP